MTARIPFSTRSGRGWLAWLLILTPLSTPGFIIPGDPGDGTIRFDAGSVDTAGVELALGHRGDGTELATAIYLFELPDLASGADVNDATLQFTFLDRSGSFATNPANADVWGLGYVASPAISTNWHLLGDTDTRTGNDLGTGIGTNPVVKVSDNFLTDQSNDPTDDPYRMVLPSADLAGFIGLLYDQGAVAGNYAVIRVSVDAATSLGNRGFDLAAADAADAATRPILRINEETVLLFDPFTDGDRTNGDDPLDGDWYKTSGDLNLVVADDSAGIGDGNALSVEMLNTGREFLCGFPEVTLSEPGDFIQLSCIFRPIFVLGADEAFRMGFFTSGGVPLTGDVTGSEENHYNGYVVRMSTGTFGDLSTVYVPSFLGGSPQDFLERHPDPFPINPPDPYTLVYTISRTSATQVTTRIELNNVVLNGMDPGTDPDPPDWAFVDTFDAIGMGVGSSSDAVDFFVDNVRVASSVPLVGIVPHVQVQAEVLELQVETQPNLHYSLQAATDLVNSNWTDSGYVITGDGGALRVYSPDPSEPAKAYRLESQP